MVDIVFDGSITLSQTSGVIGTTTNNNADAGSVGEYIESTGALAANSNATSKNITSVECTAGDWELYGTGHFNKSAGTVMSQTILWISAFSATLPGVTLRAENRYSSTNPASASSANISYTVPTARFSLSSTTTIYLSSYAAFTTSTLSSSGKLCARRVR